MIPYSDPDYFYNDAISKDLLITDGTVTVSGTSYTVTGQTVKIENDLLEQEGFELHQSLCSESQIRFGACESNYITFVMHENIPTLKGKVLKVYLIPDSDASKMVQIGVFKVDEDKLSSDRTKRTITAYDAMYDILNSDVAAWYNTELPNSSSTKTMAQFRADLMTHFGLTAESVTLANDSAVIKRTIEPESLSGADIIRAICELNGVFGTITNEGKFRYVELASGIDDGLFPSETLYPDDALYPQDVNPSVTPMSKARYIDVQFEDYNSEAITQLTIRANDEDVGVTVGTSGNRYVITGNPLVFGYSAADLTTVATNALAKMINRYYKPCTVNAVGNPLFEVGDPIRVATTYRGIVTYIFQRTMRGIQALRDTYTASGEQTINAELNSVASQFKQLANKTLKLKADIDGVSAELTEQLDDTVYGSYAYMTSQEIGLKVSKSNLVSDLDDEIGSGITIGVNEIKIKSTGTFTVDSTNFKISQSGEVSLLIKDSNNKIIISADNTGVSMWDYGFEVENDWLNINGFGYFYSNIAINGNSVHIGYQSSDVKIYKCEKIYYGTSSSSAYIDMNSSANNALALHGKSNSKVIIDSDGATEDIVLDGSVNIGNGSSNNVKLKNRYVTWKQLSSVQPTDYVLVEI